MVEEERGRAAEGFATRRSPGPQIDAGRDGAVGSSRCAGWHVGGVGCL